MSYIVSQIFILFSPHLSFYFHQMICFKNPSAAYIAGKFSTELTEEKIRWNLLQRKLLLVHFLNSMIIFWVPSSVTISPSYKFIFMSFLSSPPSLGHQFFNLDKGQKFQRKTFTKSSLKVFIWTEQKKRNFHRKKRKYFATQNNVLACV